MRQPRLFRPALLSILFTLILLASVWNGGTPASRGAPAPEPTPHDYLPLIARDGSAATTTRVPPTTPSATPTPTLSATSTATTTETPQQGCLAVYPIGLNAALFNESGFVPPTNPTELPYYIIYNDATYTNKTQRRVYLHSSTLTSTILSWNPDVPFTAAQLTAALAGTGTLSQGFGEVVPWPDPNSTAPKLYPLVPGQLTIGDWVRTVDASLINSADSTAALQYHVDQKTVMWLPIVDSLSATARMARLTLIAWATFCCGVSL